MVREFLANLSIMVNELSQAQTMLTLYMFNYRYLYFSLDVTRSPVGAKMSGTYQPLEGEEASDDAVPVVSSEADDVTPVTSDNPLSCDSQNSSSNQPESTSQNDTNSHDANESKLSMLWFWTFLSNF